MNLGVSNRTLGRKVISTKDSPSIWDEKAFGVAKKSECDVIFIMLGTNDAWGFVEESYKADYKDLIKVF